MIKEKGLCRLCNKEKIKVKGLCKPCYQKEYNNKNRNKINAMARIWSREHREQTKLYARTIRSKFKNLRSAAKSRGLKFSITENEYIELMKSPCYYCNGFFPLPEAGGGLDRLNNELGYYLDNVVSCCSICNQTRNNNWSPEETKIMILAAINFRISKLI